MATALLEVKNGYFVGCANPSYACINGWECSVKRGIIVCEASRKYKDGIHTMTFTIKRNGVCELVLRRPFKSAKVIKRCKMLQKGEKVCDGVIGLGAGTVDKRTAYFRDAKFQNFLDEHGITAVKHEDPNKSYEVRNISYDDGYCESFILTDGNITKEKIDENTELQNVEEATWVIYYNNQLEGKNSNRCSILYTMESNVVSIEGIQNVKIPKFGI